MNLLLVIPLFAAGIVVSSLTSFVLGRVFFAFALVTPLIFLALFGVGALRRLQTLQVLFVLMYFLAFSRALFAGTISFYQFLADMLIVGGVILTANYSAWRFGVARSVYLLAASFALFQVINITLTAVGLSVLDGSQSSQVESIYAAGLRVSASLSGSFTATSLEGVIAIAAGVCLVGYASKEKASGFGGLVGIVLGLFCFVAGCVGLYLGGNRAAILGGIILLMHWALRVKSKRINRVVVSGILLFPFIYLLILPALESGVLDNVFIDFSRGGIEEVLSLNNRTFIWLISLTHFISNAELINWFIGYGHYGQVASGVLERYQFIFMENHTSIAKISLHSAFLQALYNFGALGIFLYGVAILRALSALEQPALEKFMPLLLGLLWAGTVEVAIININVIWVMFHLVLFLMMTPRGRRGRH